MGGHMRSCSARSGKACDCGWQKICDETKPKPEETKP